MHYQWVEIENFECFWKPERNHFSPGVNLVVGRNNAGKSALLRALAHQFETSPHNSPLSSPNRNDSVPNESKMDFEIGVPGTELRTLLLQKPGVLLRTTGIRDNEAVTFFNGILNLNEPISFRNGRRNGAEQHSAFVVGSGGETHSDFAGQATAIALAPDREERRFELGGGNNPRHVDEVVLTTFNGRCFKFDAQRYAVSRCQLTANKPLKPDASNLPKTLDALISEKRSDRYPELLRLVQRIFPRIEEIRVEASGSLRIMVWESDRRDLARPLSHYGAGLAQTLAITTALVWLDEPSVFLIDEPNSFLHPAAARKLMRILTEYPEHQYIITTHSPVILSSFEKPNIILLEREKWETKASRIEPDRSEDIQRILASIGARLSDTFGVDAVFWVEGKTEEICIPKLLAEFLPEETRQTRWVEVAHTGDFINSAEDTVRAYRRLTDAPPLIAPAVAFLLDREDRSDDEIDDLERMDVSFLEYRAFESYLLHPAAIAHTLESRLSDTPNEAGFDDLLHIVEEELNKEREEYESDTEFLKSFDAPRFLNDLFSEYLVDYEKTTHTIEIFDWILENDRDHLAPLADFLEELIADSDSPHQT